MLIKVKRIGIRGKKEYQKIIYIISSLEKDAEEIGKKLEIFEY